MIRIRWEAILWVLISSIFRRLSKKTKTHYASFWLSVVIDCLKRNKVKISQFLKKKMIFLHTYVQKGIKSALPTHTPTPTHTHTHTHKKQAKAIFQFYFIPNISSDQKTPKNCKNRAGRDFFSGVLPYSLKTWIHELVCKTESFDSSFIRDTTHLRLKCVNLHNLMYGACVIYKTRSASQMERQRYYLNIRITQFSICQ